MAQKDPQSLGQGEDELAVGKGKEQLLIEVFVEQKGPLLSTGRGEEVTFAGERTEAVGTERRVPGAGDAPIPVATQAEGRDG
jgi:hypothetical protein